MAHATDHAADLELAHELARIADEISLPHFEGRSFAVQTKPDGSPVTDVDIEIERVLRTHLGGVRPGDAVTGEEAGATGESRRRWYLDPIDGTASFVAGELDWYTLIALAIDGESVLGVASAPAREERWWAAQGAGAYCNGMPIRVTRTAPLAAATVCDDWHETLARGVSDHPIARLASRAGSVRPHGGHAHLVVACGGADVALSRAGMSWDHAPTKVIVEQAGGRFTDLQGRTAFDSGNALVTNGLVHDEALRAAAGA
jgi:histidinol-phosphatase